MYTPQNGMGIRSSRLNLPIYQAEGIDIASALCIGASANPSPHSLSLQAGRNLYRKDLSMSLIRNSIRSTLVCRFLACAAMFAAVPALAQTAPNITTPPPITTYINEGQNVTLTVVANGDPAPTYQWRRNGVNLTNGGHFGGVTTPSLTITGANQFDAGRYTVVVTNPSGSVTSSYAYVAVRGPFWHQFQINTVPPNGASPIAMDLHRQIPVVWTSNCGNDPMASTWELHGPMWVPIVVFGRPATCARGYLTYDPVRDITIQFGGTGSDDRAYEYDGGSWVRSNIAGPTVRFGHRMVAAPEDSAIYLFGGRRASDNVLLAELYRYDGTAWTLITAPGPTPPARQDFAMGYDPNCRKVIVFGGNGASGALGDTWEYDTQTQTWAQSNQPTGTPSARSASTMMYYPEQSSVYMFGGLVGASFVNGSWRYNCTTHQWSLASISVNPPASQGYMTYDNADRRLLLLQGTETWEMLTYHVGCPADFNGNITVNTQDLFDFVNGFFGGTADFNGDGTVNSQDFFDYLGAFFSPC